MHTNFDLLEYVNGLVQLRKRGRYHEGPCPMCGGTDRFQIKTDNLLWICRTCCTDGKYHDAIDFMMRFHQVDFKEAIRLMGEELPERKPHAAPRAPVVEFPSLNWQKYVWKHIDGSSDRLIENPQSDATRYLAKRGISRGSIFMHLLGFALYKNRPAIVIPWMDTGDVITAVKYRFIDNGSQRYDSLKGSKLLLFGLQHVQASDDTLLFVEGEFNAISVLQTLPQYVSVVSAGSQGAGNGSILQALAKRYRRVVIWMDEVNKSKAIAERMNRQDARLFKSPQIDGVKWDANRMLQANVLPEFLTRQLNVPCLAEVHERNL